MRGGIGGDDDLGAGQAVLDNAGFSEHRTRQQTRQDDHAPCRGRAVDEYFIRTGKRDHFPFRGASPAFDGRVSLPYIANIIHYFI